MNDSSRTEGILIHQNGEDRLEILTTAIILAFLELKFGDRRDEWKA
jgi:hypothetical protein